MALLGPWVREENVHAIQAGGGNHVLENFDRIVLDDANVFEFLFVDSLKQCANPGIEHFNAKKILFRHLFGNFGCGFTHAEADFQDDRRFASEGCVSIQDTVVKRDDPTLREGFQRGFLPLGDMTATMNEAANVLLMHLRNQELAPANSYHYFYSVVFVDGEGGVLATWNDIAVDFDGNALASQAELLKQVADSSAGCNSCWFAIQKYLHVFIVALY